MRTLRRIASAAFVLGAFARPAYCVVSAARVTGVVELRGAATQGWELVLSTAPRRLSAGDELRTGAGASAAVFFDDASTMALGPATEAILSGSTARPIVELTRGRLRASFGRDLSKAVRVDVADGAVAARAPGSTAFIELGATGPAVVEVVQGVVVVSDARGRELAVHAGQRVRLDLRGAGAPDDMPRDSELARERRRFAARRELGFDRQRDSLLSGAARDARLSELQQGRALVDSRGARVRIETYVVRPTADSVRFVTLNSRAGRFDAFSLYGVFDRVLPTELSAVLAELPGRADVAPGYVMTSFTTLRTNGIDAVVERAEAGHAVDLNANADPLDDVTSLFDPRTGMFYDTTGRAVFKTLYDRYGLYVDGTLKRGWRGAGITSYDPGDAVPSAASGLDPITGAAAAVFAVARNTAFPDPALAHRVVYESYGDGSVVQWDISETNAGGDVGGRGRTFGLGANLEQTLQCSEMNGRHIELVLPAALPAAAGLLP